MLDCDLCIWHYTEWIHVGLVICVSDIIQNGSMLDLWSVNLTLYRMMLDSWSGSDIIQNDAMWTRHLYLTLYRMTACWTRDLCIWHYTEWWHVGLVICVSDIIQNDGMLDLWSVYLTLYRMTHVGLVICVSDIIQNDAMLDSWSVYLTLYRMMLDLWSVYLTLYRMMLDSWSVYLT